MIISEEDKNNLIKEYGLQMEHHFAGDKTLEERLKEIDEEYDSMVTFGKQFGPEYMNWFNSWVPEAYTSMKEDLKKLYNK